MKVISFAVWGDDPMYKIGLIENLKLKEYYYPDWDVICFVDNMGQRFVREAAGMGCIIKPIGDYGGWKNSLIRYMPCMENHTVIVRDTDSRFTMREKDAVEQWLKSDKSIHVMRDHPFHNEKIMGGMCGFRNGVLKSYEGDLYNWLTNDVNERLIAEKFFDKIYEERKHDIYFNISHNAFEGEDWKPFIKRKLGEFVGEIFDQNNNRHPEHYKQVIQE